MDDSLESFREQWKKELSGSETNGKEESYDLYRQALYYEREGQPYEAVRFYRQAFKANPDLENSREEQLKADFLPLYNDKATESDTDPYKEVEIENEHSLPNLNTLSLDDTSLSHLPSWSIPFSQFPCMKNERKEDIEDSADVQESKDIEKVEKGPIHISEMPAEAILKIFSFLDAASLDKSGGVCKHWFLVSREKALWKGICLSSWPGQGERLIEQVSQQLQDNWRKLFLEKPRPRLDGVYISLNSYIRSGLIEGATDLPVFKVKYYRYMRFFKDGRVLLCCTPTIPKIVVPTLKLDYNGGKVKAEAGKYDIMAEEHLSECKIFVEHEKETSTPRLVKPTYCFLLRIGNSYRGWHDRLIVEEYYSQLENVKNPFRKNFVSTYKFVHVPEQFFDTNET